MDNIRVSLQDSDGSFSLDIPNNDDMIKPCTSQDSTRTGVPTNNADFALVPSQVSNIVHQIFTDPSIWYIPNLDSTIFWAGGNDVVLKGIPL